MNYDVLGKYTIEEANEKIRKMHKEYIDLSIQLDKLERRNLPKEEMEKQRLEIERSMLLLGYEIDAEEWKKRIAQINVSQKDKMFKRSTKNEQQRIAHNNRAHSNILDVGLNPLLSSKYKDLMDDTRSIRVLREFTNIIKRDNDGKLRPEIAELFKIVEPVFKEYNRIINEINVKLDSLMNEIRVSMEQKTVRREKEFEAFKKDLAHVISNNRYKHDTTRDFTEANDKIKSIHRAKSIEKSIKDLHIDIGIDTSLIRSNLGTINLIEMIEKMNTMLATISGNIPQTALYGNVSLDFSKLHEEINKAERLLNSKKELNETKLEEKGFNKEFDKIKQNEMKTNLLRQLAKEYEKLTPDIKGSVRRQIEEEIEALIADSVFNENEIETIKIDAQKIASMNKSDKEFEKRSKFHETEKKIDRSIAIKNREGVTEEEIDSIRREAEAAAKSRFPEDYVMKSGDAHDLNGDERQKFIESYIDEKLSHLSAYKVDEKERQRKSDDEITSRNYDEIARENITEQMMSVAAEVLMMDDKVKDADPSKLTPGELSQAIQTAKQLKKYVGLEGMELARKMVEDKMVDKNQPINMADVMVQFNLNNLHNINGKINSYFNNEGMTR